MIDEITQKIFLLLGQERIDYIVCMDTRKTRLLTQFLIISGTLNLALIASFVNSAWSGKKGRAFAQTPREKIKKITLKKGDVLDEFSHMDYDVLVRELYNETHVEEGQRRCDLALAALTAFHAFDVERAFAGHPIEKREITYNGQVLTLFAGIGKDPLDGIRTFARREVWPLTPKGLFEEIIKRERPPFSLKEAFSQTQEYFVIHRALSRLPFALGEETLFSLICQGSFEDLKAFADELQEITQPSFSSFLLPRIKNGSQLAAYLMIFLEKEVALKQLDNGELETLISLLTEKTPEVEQFLEEVKGGIRPQAIQELAGKPLEDPPRRYVVQMGDSLWKIARKFDVKVETIQKMNALQSETLQPGTELLLPKEGLGPRGAKGCNEGGGGS